MNRSITTCKHNVLINSNNEYKLIHCAECLVIFYLPKEAKTEIELKDRSEYLLKILNRRLLEEILDNNLQFF